MALAVKVLVPAVQLPWPDGIVYSKVVALVETMVSTPRVPTPVRSSSGVPHSPASLTVTSKVTSGIVPPLRTTEAGVADPSVSSQTVVGGPDEPAGGVPTIVITALSVRVEFGIKPVMSPFRVQVTDTSMRSSPTSTGLPLTVEHDPPPGRAAPPSSRQRTATVGVPFTLPASFAVDGVRDLRVVRPRRRGRRRSRGSRRGRPRGPRSRRPCPRAPRGRSQRGRTSSGTGAAPGARTRRGPPRDHHELDERAVTAPPPRPRLRSRDCRRSCPPSGLIGLNGVLTRTVIVSPGAIGKLAGVWQPL